MACGCHAARCAADAVLVRALICCPSCRDMNAGYSAASLGDGYTAHVDTFARDRLPPREQWPEFRFDLPELHYPPRLNCASALLDDAILEGHGARIALYSAGGNWTYFELLERANRIANVLVRDL